MVVIIFVHYITTEIDIDALMNIDSVSWPRCFKHTTPLLCTKINVEKMTLKLQVCQIILLGYFFSCSLKKNLRKAFQFGAQFYSESRDFFSAESSLAVNLLVTTKSLNIYEATQWLHTNHDFASSQNFWSFIQLHNNASSNINNQ